MWTIHSQITWLDENSTPRLKQINVDFARSKVFMRVREEGYFQTQAILLDAERVSAANFMDFW